MNRSLYLLAQFVKTLFGLYNLGGLVCLSVGLQLVVAFVDLFSVTLVSLALGSWPAAVASLSALSLGVDRHLN